MGKLYLNSSLSSTPNIPTSNSQWRPFLDVLVRRNEDGTLSHVYRKPTHTDRYLHANSHHHPAQKNSVISSLVYRALSISEPAALNGELNHLHRTLTRNGYSSRNINRTINKLTNKESGQNNTTTPETEKEKIKAVVLPYVRGTTDRISRILSKHNIKAIFKPCNKLSQMLPNPKDRRPPLTAPGVYKVPFSCGKVYIGETGRKISTRIKEHQRCTKYGHFSQSALAEHKIETGHAIQFDKATMLAPSQSYFARKHREALQQALTNAPQSQGPETPFDSPRGLQGPILLRQSVHRRNREED
ncbi:PREDICTED: uncharacterized protein LOC105557319 [Vollenhovia emeryi]|uniref:uncharacterized protein LOC105557319 n=1 Tax=Vollenhovia emeryi TaxID=411798 RepID=UPI0005F39448|nr:PREDICTED: uncharacterized protein LOC105557319 [Vollenhovia emeryi]